MIDRAYIGVETPEFPIDVETGRIRQFAAAISETNPIYFDEAAARAAGHPAILAPPTFGFTLSILHPHPIDFEKMGLSLERGIYWRHFLPHRDSPIMCATDRRLARPTSL